MSSQIVDDSLLHQVIFLTKQEVKIIELRISEVDTNFG